jgi:hypothetical protein
MIRIHTSCFFWNYKGTVFQKKYEKTISKDFMLFQAVWRFENVEVEKQMTLENSDIYSI